MNRRKIRRYRKQRGNTGVKVLGMVGIMMIAVACGYLTARFIIAPLMGYDTEVLKLDFPSKFTDVFQGNDKNEENSIEESDAEVEDSGTEDNSVSAAKEDGDDTEEKTAGADSGYALQFGLFSTRSRADQLVDKLDKEGIDAKIKETDGQYKVVSPLIKTKEEALETLKNTKSTAVNDIFITRL